MSEALPALRVPIDRNAGAIDWHDPPARIESLPDGRVRVEMLLPHRPAQTSRKSVSRYCSPRRRGPSCKGRPLQSRRSQGRSVWPRVRLMESVREGRYDGCFVKFTFGACLASGGASKNG